MPRGCLGPPPCRLYADREGIFLSIATIVILIVGITVLVLLAAWVWYMKRSSRADEDLFDDMEGAEFENYCAELLEAKGFENVEITPGSHDYGIDIVADREGISYAIQCKCYSDNIGIRAVQEAYAGRDYYKSMVGVVMTNQYFTKSAREFAEKLNILLWDGDYIMNLIHEVAIPEKRSMMGLLAGNQRKKPEPEEF